MLRGQLRAYSARRKSCLCVSFEDQNVCIWCLVLCGSQTIPWKASMCWFRQCPELSMGCELPGSHYEEAWSALIFVESASCSRMGVLQSPYVCSWANCGIWLSRIGSVPWRSKVDQRDRLHCSQMPAPTHPGLSRSLSLSHVCIWHCWISGYFFGDFCGASVPWWGAFSDWSPHWLVDDTDVFFRPCCCGSRSDRYLMPWLFASVSGRSTWDPWVSWCSRPFCVQLSISLIDARVPWSRISFCCGIWTFRGVVWWWWFWRGYWRQRVLSRQSAHAPHTRRNMGFHRHTDGGTIQRNQSPSVQEHLCFESWKSETKEWQRYHTLQCGFIEHRTLIFAQFTQQIRSVSTEQSQAGVKGSVKRLRIRKSRLRKGSWQKKMSSYWRIWSRKKWILWCKLRGVIIQHLGTDCENVFRDLKHWRKVSNLQKFVKVRHSGEESLLGWATKPFLT